MSIFVNFLHYLYHISEIYKDQLLILQIIFFQSLSVPKHKELGATLRYSDRNFNLKKLILETNFASNSAKFVFLGQSISQIKIYNKIK